MSHQAERTADGCGAGRWAHRSIGCHIDEVVSESIRYRHSRSSSFNTVRHSRLIFSTSILHIAATAQGKPVERRGRKASGLRLQLRSADNFGSAVTIAGLPGCTTRIFGLRPQARCIERRESQGNWLSCHASPVGRFLSHQLKGATLPSRAHDCPSTGSGQAFDGLRTGPSAGSGQAYDDDSYTVRCRRGFVESPLFYFFFSMT